MYDKALSKQMMLNIILYFRILEDLLFIYLFFTKNVNTSNVRESTYFTCLVTNKW